MSDEERKEPTAEELKAAEERWQKLADDSLVERFHRYQALAFRLVVGELESNVPVQYDVAEVRHMAEMLFLIDIATGQTAFSRFRSRYAGNY